MVDSQPTDTVSVITVTFNSQKTIGRLLSTLRRHIDARVAEVLVIDNRSTDRTAEVVRSIQEEWPKLVLIQKSENLGYRKAVNAAARLASHEFLLVINPDAWLEDNSLCHCIDQLGSDESIGCACPVIIEPSNWVKRSAGSKPVIPFVAWWPENIPQGQKAARVSIGPGQAFIVRRSEFSASGGYEEGPFMFNEEEELSLKLKSRGLKVVVHPVAMVYHEGGVSVRSWGHRWEFQFTHQVRNARFLYHRFVRESAFRRFLWYLFYILQSVEYSIAIRSCKPLRAALAPWAKSRDGLAGIESLQAEWNLMLWIAVKVREINAFQALVRSRNS